MIATMEPFEDRDYGATSWPPLWSHPMIGVLEPHLFIKTVGSENMVSNILNLLVSSLKFFVQEEAIYDFQEVRDALGN